ncbi:MAG: NERD domain-containing protein/DEAD/DEAH box helicase [Chloroflexi bacterium]|nr:NERD domain-containing protein/DEAD/DEAH box helicase [Chloroflexota bacterium]
MARMIPPRVADDVRSSGERLIFDKLRLADNSRDWTVLHSLSLEKHTRQLYGEIDFLVLAPRLGVFCLEVKAGGIKREEGFWKFTNRYGESIMTTKSPFGQARDAMYSLMIAIREHFGDGHRLTRIVYDYGVIFTDIKCDFEGIEIDEKQVYDREDMEFTPIQEYIKRLSKHIIEKVKGCNWFDTVESLPNEKDISDLVAFLRGNFEKPVTLEVEINDIESQLNQYTIEQYACLDAMQDNPRCLFEGAAGTGKTMIALESARRAVFDGKRVLFVCYNVILGRWLASQFNSNVSDPKGNLYVGHFLHFLTTIPTVPKADHETLADRNDYFKKTLPKQALSALRNHVIKPFDKLIIDEGQDLSSREYLEVFDALLKNGLAGGNWEIYCDFKRQAIFSGGLTTEQMLQLLKRRAGFSTYHLTVNCRNTVSIGESVSMLSGFEKPPFLPGKVYGNPVKYHFFENAEEECRILENLLAELDSQGIPPNRITILSPLKHKNSCIKKVDGDYPQLLNISAPSSEDSPLPITCTDVQYHTIQSFKGMENSYIILIDVESINGDWIKHLLYVGMSRAKAGLALLVSKSSKQDLEEMLRKSKAAGN